MRGETGNNRYNRKAEEELIWGKKWHRQSERTRWGKVGCVCVNNDTIHENVNERIKMTKKKL